MLYYDRINISKGIHYVKISSSKECMVCHYWFFNHRFKYHDSVCNDCHDLLRQCVNVSDIVIITIKGADYHCIIHEIAKPDN